MSTTNDSFFWLHSWSQGRVQLSPENVKRMVGEVTGFIYHCVPVNQMIDFDKRKADGKQSDSSEVHVAPNDQG